MVNKGKKTEITTLKCCEKAKKGQKKCFGQVRKNFGKKFQKSEKTAFLTGQKKLEVQSGSYGYFKCLYMFILLVSLQFILDER